MQDYILKRSNRKTLCLEIKEGKLIVKAPLRISQAEIDSFLFKNREWIQKHLERSLAQQEALKDIVPLTWEELRALAEKALDDIPKRVAFWAEKIGVTYGKITIRNQKTKWGSCSSKGNLNFNCLLMLTPPEVIDSVVVHELCHRKEMNHSKQFYHEVYQHFPDYDKWDKWLKDHGSELQKRMPK